MKTAALLPGELPEAGKTYMCTVSTIYNYTEGRLYQCPVDGLLPGDTDCPSGWGPRLHPSMNVFDECFNLLVDEEPKPGTGVTTYYELLQELTKAGHHDVFQNLEPEQLAHLEQFKDSTNWVLVLGPENEETVFVPAISFVGCDHIEDFEDRGLVRFLDDNGGDDDASNAHIEAIIVDGQITHGNSGSGFRFGGNNDNIIWTE